MLRINLHTILPTILLFLIAASAFAQTCDVLEGCGDINPNVHFDSLSQSVFCEGEVVTLINDSDSTRIDSTIFNWGDGTIDRFTGTPNAEHIYDFSRDTCLPAGLSLTLPITVTVFKKCDLGISRNCIILFVRIRVTPKARFSTGAGLCANNMIVFDNRSCANDEQISYEWRFDDVVVSEEENIEQIFTERRTFKVTLVATNRCGSDELTRTVRIRDIPEAAPDLTPVPATGCAPARIKFKNESIDIDTSIWTITPSDSVRYIDSTTNTSTEPVVQITEEGSYMVNLKVGNACGFHDTTAVFEVLGKPQAVLEPPPVGCGSLNYTPQVTYEGPPGAITDHSWIFTGGQPENSTDSLPAGIHFERPDEYPISLTVEGPCGHFIVEDTVRVIEKQTIRFEAVDTVCSTADPFQINVNVPGGDWSGPSGVIDQDGRFYPGAAVEGPNILTYSVGPEHCRSTAQLEIVVLAAEPVDIGAEMEQLCLNGGHHTFTFSPAGGRWEGEGIVDSLDGVFDPRGLGQGTSLLSYRYTAPSGCIVTKTKTVEVITPPTLAVPDSLTTCLVDSDFLLGDLFMPAASPPGGSFRWHGDGVGDPQTGLFNPSHAGSDTVALLLTYTNPAGCDTTVSLHLMFTEFVEAQAQPDTSVCSGDAALQLASWPTGGQWSGRKINSATGEIQLGELIPGTHDFIYIIQEGTPCESSDTVQVVIHDAANSVSAGPDLYRCETESRLVLTGTPENGSWEGPELQGNEVDISRLPAGREYVYTYRVPELPAACNADNLTLRVMRQPTAGFSTDSIACENVPVSFVNATTGADQYRWSFGDGDTSGLQHPQHSYSPADIYSVQLEASLLHPVDGTPVCTAAATKEIIVSKPPERVDFSVDVTEGCGPLPVSFDNLSRGENLRFRWDFGFDSPLGTAEPGTVVFPPATEDTVYTVRLQVDNTCGETESSQDITVFPLPKANFGILFDEPCSRDTLLLNNTSTGSPNSHRWTISSRHTNRAFDEFNPPVILPRTDSLPDTLAVRLVSTNVCGIDSTERFAVVHPTDVRAFFNLSEREICLDDTLRLTNFSTPGAPIRWELSDGNTYGSQKVAHLFQEAGSYTITIFAEGCGYDSLTQAVTVLPLPQAELEVSPIICQGAPAAFHLQTDAPAHQLYYGDGDSTYLNISEHTFEDPGGYAVSWWAVSTAGCIRRGQSAIQVETRPEAAFSVPAGVCSGAPVRFNSNSAGTVACRWEFGDGGGASECNPFHTYEAGGSYRSRLIAISDLGCRDTTDQQIYIRSTPEAGFAIQLLEDCAPAAVMVQDTSTGASSLDWDLGDNNTDDRPAFEHTYQQGGTFSIRLITSNEELCRDTVTQPVTILPRPGIEAELTEHCTEIEGVDLTVHTEAANFTLVTGPDYQETGVRHEMLASGDYLVSVESPDGCLEEKTVFVPRVRELIITLPRDSFELELGEELPLYLGINQEEVRVEWSPSDGLSDPSSPTPVARPNHTINYHVTATNDLGCSKMETVHIKVRIDRETGIYIPNAFTPDGNGINDIFRIKDNNAGMTGIRRFQVFDQLGELVFEAADCQADDALCGWDGTFRGQKAEMGVYTYVVELEFSDGFVDLLKGEVTLIR